MAEPFRTTRLVEFHDTDMAGIMHFAAFFQYMESAEHELIRRAGFSVHSSVAGETLSFPRVATSCQFHSPARCEELLDIEVQITRIGTKSLTYQVRFTHEEREVATGEITCVCCRVTPGEPITSAPIPTEIADSLREYLA